MQQRPILPIPRRALSERMYRMLLRLYPRWYRRVWGDGLAEFFRDQYHEAVQDRGWVGAISTWTRAGFDTITSALAVRFGRTPSNSPGKIYRRRKRGPGMWWDNTRHSLIYASRQLRQSPGLTLAIMLTLGLGIGANATMFGVIDRLLLRPPEHVRDANQIRRVLVTRSIIGVSHTSPVGTYPDYEDFDDASSFLQTATYSHRNTQTLGRGLGAQRVSVVETTASLFPLLGVRPHLGRFFSSVEDQPEKPGLAVLDYSFWRRQFGGDLDVLGQSVKLGDRSYTVVGVAPKGFTGAELRRVDVWVNLHSRPGGWATSRNWFFLTPVARLRAGVELGVAEAEATMIHRRGRLAQTHYDRQATITLAPLIAARGPNPSDESVVARWLGGVALVVLLIACANVANLLLVRGVQRRREMAIRLALGVSRTRLVSQLLVESVMLAALGGLTGVLLAWWGGKFVRSVLSSEVAWVHSPVSGRVLLFSALAVLLTGIAAGLVPALQATRSDIATTLKSGDPGSRAGSRTRVALLLAQGALSVVLLVGAGLFVRSLSQVRNLDLGFDPDGVLVATMEFERAMAGDSLSMLRWLLHAEAVAKLASVPGIHNTGSTMSIPFWSRSWWQLEVPGLDSIPSLPTGGPYVSSVSPGYFETMGMKFVRGRAFTDAGNSASAEPVAVVNQTMARLLWPDEDPLGQCMLIGRDPAGCSRVVGVVVDMREDGFDDNDIAMLYFIPVEHPAARTPGNVLVRVTAGQEERYIETVRREIGALHPAIRYVNVRPLQTLIDPRARSWRLGATMFTVFGCLALLVAVVGLYSLLAFNVAQRTRELGIRAALGAQRAHIITLVLRQALFLVFGGLAIGVLIALTTAASIEPLLFRVSARDPMVFLAVVGTLSAAGLIAAILPAHRATAVDLIETLRTE